MAQVSITQLPQAQALTGTESVPIVQNGVTVQTTTGAISGAGALNYPFLTVGTAAGLTESRYIAATTGLSVTDNGPGNSLQINLTGAALSLDSSGTGLQVKTGPNTLTGREITVGGGMTIADGDGVAGNPLIGLNTNLQNLAALSGVGLMTINGSVFGHTSITGTANQVNVTDGDALLGPPTIGLASNPVLPGNGAVTVPIGTSGQRLDGNGNIRYNTTLARFEGYQAGVWTTFGVGDGTVTSVSGVSGQIVVTNPTTTPIIGLATNPSLPGTGSVLLPGGTTAERSAAGFGAIRYNSQTQNLEGYVPSVGWGAIAVGTGVSTFSAGTTGLTPNTPTAGAIVLGGILSSGSGGTGVNNGASTITVGGNFSTIGAFSIDLTATGVTSVTLPTTGTLATLAGAETLTNKTISGANNTLTNIGNSSLTNSSVTYNGVTVGLGASGTITATTTAALTAGTGLQLDSGTTFDGSVAKTISIDSTVATLTGSQILTNKTISGNSNTLSNIGNSSLTNSSLTVNGVSISLGGSGTITSNTTNSLTFNNGGSGAASGTAFNGSTAYTISYNTIGASPLAGSTSLTTLGTVTTGTWNATPIANNYLANSSVTIGTTSILLGGSTLTLGGLTSVAVTQDPTTALQLATKQYVDGLVSSGLAYHQPVQAATTQSLAAQTGGTVTYNNGTGGVGATITLSVALTTLDGYSLANTNRILVKDEVNQAYNGVYTWATGGTVLTRSTDTNSYGPGTNQLSEGDYFFVQNGTVNKGNSYVCSTVGTITFGTTAITFSQFGTSQIYTAGTGLTLTNTTFSISNTGVTANTYGSASQSLTATVNAQGQLTSLSAQSIAINGNQITSGTVGSSYISGSYTGITGVGTLTAGTWNASTIGVGYGGTGLATYTAGDLLYATGSTTLAKLGIGTNGQVLTSSGTAPQWTSGSSISVGTATNLAGGTTGAVPYQTGAGATTFLALGTTNYVMTAGATAPQYVAQSTLSVGAATNVSGGTIGALPYQTGAGATTFLALGTTNYVLTAGASAPQYVAQSTLSVGSATNATNTAITANSANATNYLTFVSATTGNLPQLVNSSITCNPSTGQITGGVAGGAF